jgi:hypothetical protein
MIINNLYMVEIEEVEQRETLSEFWNAQYTQTIKD